ncbi:MAG: bifunctional (p)ppGpp synthetase/guanosine-3',5'-bis(diphosphate) 3'-pyrophosphohydrolase [Burkholderiales bacterium]|jgi:RelA/SpoT family (p)ppGpp synthetase|nr:bifunctional (p)ppGpp synthetase/guanosine-3',5'-bis(diphosphate) 3'-pyrophosphohydrolase [Burkholderiales bacterium]
MTPLDISVNHFFESLRQYLPDDDVTLVERAFRFAEKAHEGQRRLSGDPYITHPLAVASTLAGWQLDAQALAAALLHDVLEDTGARKEKLNEEFGSVVAELVSAVSKLDKLEFSSYKEAQAENFRKMLLAMARDVRVILIKLADRFHNMQTLESIRLDKRQRIARETYDIYVPLAYRLGLYALRQGLLDLSFQNLRPARHRVIEQAIENVRHARRETVDNVIALLQDRLQRHELKAEVSGRERTPYSTYSKMREKRIPFAQVMESYGIRIIVDTREHCYAALGVLHEALKPIPGRFKDYIAIPKANGYQSLHTTLFGPGSMPIDVQIRTHDMNLVADAGIAAYWMYRSASDFANLVETQQNTRQWLKGLLEMPLEADSIEFVDNIKRDLFPEEIYVFTPKGKIFTLPLGATVLDFAYAVHTDIGHHCAGARVNHEAMPMRTVLRNGSQVEIITNPETSPTPTWLSFVVTGRARSAIRNFLKNQQKDEAEALGERLLHHSFSIFKIKPDNVAPDLWQALAENYSAKTLDDLYVEIGRGKILPFTVAQTLVDKLTKTTRKVGKNTQQKNLKLPDGQNTLLRYAACCHPLPRDPIIGWMRSGLGLEVHIRDCAVLKERAPEQHELIDVAWPAEAQALYASEILLWAKDRHGLLADLTSVIAKTDTNIAQLWLDRSSPQEPITMGFLLDVRNRQQLAEILRGLRRVAGVKKVQRARKTA